MKLIDDFFKNNQALPMLPKVVQEVMQLLNTDDVDIGTLADKINHDQVLSGRVLRMSNSAYFGCSRHVSTIEEAVSLIGLAKLKTLVVASGVTSAFTEVPGLDLKRFWQHSLIVASIARQIANEQKLDADVAYIAGLMHTVGQLPIHMLFPKAGAVVEDTCKGKSVLERAKVEQSVIGVNHNLVGERLAQYWKFPEEISRVIRYYTDPLDKNACKLASIVYVAAHIGFDLESGKSPSYIVETLSADVAAQFGPGYMDGLADRIETYRTFVSEAKSYV